jgi:hypothetical protein
MSLRFYAPRLRTSGSSRPTGQLIRTPLAINRDGKPILKEPRLLKIAAAIVIPLAILGLVGFILRVYQKIVTGHGLETYTTGWGVQMNYIGVLITFILIPVVLIGGWLINYFITRDERQLRKQIELQKKRNQDANKC